jgi:hypothetical protein
MLIHGIADKVGLTKIRVNLQVYNIADEAHHKLSQLVKQID